MLTIALTTLNSKGKNVKPPKKRTVAKENARALERLQEALTRP